MWIASICSVIVLVYAALTYLFRTWLGGQAVSGWFFSLAIISCLSLLMPGGLCHCAVCYMSIIKAEEERKLVKKTALPKALRKV